MIFEDVKLIVEKFRIAKIDRNAMINNTVLLILAWIAAYWIFQFFTIVPAFSMGVNMLVYNNEIDFSSVNTAASQRDLWSSAENVNYMFFTPLIFSIVLQLVAVLYFIKWDSDRLNMRRFLFWLILCITIRITGNFIFGQLFHLWNWNLITDFMYITYPSVAGKYIAIFLCLFIAIIIFRAMASQIKKLFNPYLVNRVNNLISNVFLPVAIASVFLLLWNMPFLPKNELWCIIMFFVLGVFSVCRPFIRRYRGIAEEVENEEYEPVNVPLLGVLGVLIIFDIIFAKGIFLQSSPYRFFFVENTILCIVLFTMVLVLVATIYVYYHRRNQYIKKIAKEREKIDKDKIFVKQEDKDKYGFKQYDLTKYNKKNF